MPTEFPYTNSPNSLRRFLKGVPDRAVPPKVTYQHLAAIGLKSSNDRTIVSVLKAVGLLDGNGAPTEEYKQFRDKARGPAVLAAQIRKAYKALYDTYEDAHAQDDETLRNFFSANTSVGSRAIQYIVATFKVQCEFADFSRVSAALSRTETSDDTGRLPSTVAPASFSGPQLHVNLQIHLPDSKDPEVYDSIFAAISRHLRRMV